MNSWKNRLEAYRALGQVEIPALVIDANEEDCLVMSLVENIARRQHRQIELVRPTAIVTPSTLPPERFHTTKT